MKAIAITAFGGRNKLKLTGLPAPEAQEEEILIKIKAAGVNPVDWKIREGLLRRRLPYEFPIIPGWDAAGIVEQAGSGAGLFKPGDEVYAYCRKPVIKDGTYAEFVSVPQEHAADKPTGLSFEEAASVPLAALTAYQSLFETAGLKKGMDILIHAAAGGVGGFSVQLAAAAGARVIGTAGGPNRDYVSELGAAAVIDYTKGDFRNEGKTLAKQGFDIILDCVGGDVTFRSMDVLKAGGVLVSIVRPYTKEIQKAIMGRRINYKYVFVRPEGTQLAVLGNMLEDKTLKTRLQAVLPMEEAAKAHEIIEKGHARGKIVLRV